MWVKEVKGTDMCFVDDDGVRGAGERYAEFEVPIEVHGAAVQWPVANRCRFVHQTQVEAAGKVQ